MAHGRKRGRTGGRILNCLFFTAVFVLLLLSLSISWTIKNYHNIGFDEILFHLNMPLQGAGIYVNNYLKVVLKPAIGIFAEILAGAVFVFLFFHGSRKFYAELAKRSKYYEREFLYAE